MALLITVPVTHHASADVACKHQETRHFGAEYFNKVKVLADSLAAAGHTLRDEEVGCYLLIGLDRDYDPFVTYVATSSEPMSLSEVYSHFLSFVMRLAGRNNPMQLDGGSSVNFTAQNCCDKNSHGCGGSGGRGYKGHGRG